MPNGEFEKLLVEAIDESFYSLGESPKQAILFHLENTFKIDKQKIPDKIDSFDNALKNFWTWSRFPGSANHKKTCEKADAFFKSLPTD